jgi:hypothetical protein
VATAREAERQVDGVATADDRAKAEIERGRAEIERAAERD